MAIDPKNVRALVVGIEAYDIGPKWRLPGPASDAIEFVLWLRRNKVPAENIALFLDFEDVKISKELMNRVAQEDLIPKGTAHECHILPFLRKDLRTWKAELFYFFWGGHGLNVDNRRRLFLSNLSDGLAENLDLENCQTALRSNLYPGLINQVWYVDACADDFESQYSQTRSLGGQTLTFDKRRTTTKQLSFFAAAAGQAAFNHPSRRAGRFSDAILDCFSRKSPVNLFPPDHRAIFREAKSQLSSSGQLPITIEWWDDTGEAVHIDLSDWASIHADPVRLKDPSSIIRGQDEVSSYELPEVRNFSDSNFPLMLEYIRHELIPPRLSAFLSELNRTQPKVCQAFISFAMAEPIAEAIRANIEKACYGDVPPITVNLHENDSADLLAIIKEGLSSDWAALSETAFRYLEPQQGPRRARQLLSRFVASKVELRLWPWPTVLAHKHQATIQIPLGSTLLFDYHPNGKSYWPHFEVSVSAGPTSAISIHERDRSTKLNIFLSQVLTDEDVNDEQH